MDGFVGWSDMQYMAYIYIYMHVLPSVLDLVAERTQH